MKKQLETHAFFYRAGHFATEKQGKKTRSVFGNPAYPCAETHSDQLDTPRMLAVDANSSVLLSDTRQKTHSNRYTPYGFHGASSAFNLLAFNGQRKDSLTSLYLLGDGHRSYSPALLRFLSADSLSPFDAGGINAYAYCGGDPINRVDPTGQSWISSFFKGVGNLFGRTRGSDRPKTKELRSILKNSTTTSPTTADTPTEKKVTFAADTKAPSFPTSTKRDPSPRTLRRQNWILDKQVDLETIEHEIKVKRHDIGTLTKHYHDYNPKHKLQEIDILEKRASRIRESISKAISHDNGRPLKILRSRPRE